MRKLELAGRTRLLLFLLLSPLLNAREARAENLVRTGQCSIDFVENSGLSAAALQPNALVQAIADFIANTKANLAVAAHDLDHPVIVTALLDAAARGVLVRVFTDSKDSLSDVLNGSRGEEYYRALSRRIVLEQLRRGLDGAIGTADDVFLQADAPIEALEGPTKIRLRNQLPSTARDVPRHTYYSGRRLFNDTAVLARGMLKEPLQANNIPEYYAPGSSRMHHKFMVADGRSVLTGSYNFTVSGAEGSTFDRAVGAELGHRQHLLTIENVEIAGGYLRAFDSLWGGSGSASDDAARLREPVAGHFDFMSLSCGFPISVAFLPNPTAIHYVSERLSHARRSIYFEFFSFTHVELIKKIYERGVGSGVGVHGLIDARFYPLFRAQAESLGGDVLDFFEGSSTDDARIEKSRLYRLLHTKTLIVDGLEAEAVVITGSANFSETAFESNRENILFLNSQVVALAFTKSVLRFAAANRVNRETYCPAVWDRGVEESEHASAIGVSEED
ncbi:hypothetical protein DC522_03130 [Microvirga sp. KLBC 81]|uniref:phospholipase D-like domain-containing protein n=1 Tax=Microvirga sp. KLBC 81 TaxID=1862707 RepID=UPI000D51CD04|nr:phospholipase D-like domain-containing protein [Microvirga sp. KLBC 81]PVE25780.1 hypothetical protein DC522_03130 [Microvirga sp. KLBC 81]